MAKAESKSAAPKTKKEQLVQAGVILGVAVAAMWGLELIDWVTGHALDDALGIHPRHAAGLVGLVGSPFMHANVAHLVGNTVPFAVLGFFVMLRGVPTFARVTIFTALVGGFFVWLTASYTSNHIGASGVIFGYFGYLLAAAWFERSVRSILVAVLVAFLYGGIVFGMFPTDRVIEAHISWQGHLFGFLSGAGWAFLSIGRKRLAAKKAKAQG
ncbi:MAG: rhomboid family intramembrane serine protease [Deltaproteobacteria bacterium]|nr:MAG: rhomboid family intramembrane serine protease [Deltaproteobacteria bacterium]